MKRVWIGALVALAFLLIVALIVYKVVHVPPPAKQAEPVPQAFPTGAPAAPAELVRGCYTWYVDSFFVAMASSESQDAKREAQKCFTADFIGRWSSVAESTGSDPVLLSQDFASSWKSMDVTMVGQNETQAIALVTLGTGDEAKKLNVYLTVEGGSWKISNVQPFAKQ